MAEHAPTRPKHGPAPYFPSIEKKHGRSIGHWQQIIADCGLDKHMALAGYVKAEHGKGHRHAKRARRPGTRRQPRQSLKRLRSLPRIGSPAVAL